MKRIIAILLAVSLVAALIVPVSADNVSGSSNVVEVEYSKDLVDVWDNHFHDTWSILGGEAIGFLSGYFVNLCWQGMSDGLLSAGIGRADSLAVLQRRAEAFNQHFKSILYGAVGYVTWFGELPHAEVMWVENLNAYVICDSVRGIPLITNGGAYAYYRDANADNPGGGRWLGSRSCDINGKVVLLTEDVLSNLCLDLNGMGQTCTVTTWGGKYRVIQKDNYYYYCNPDGLPYVARIDESSHASNTTNNYYTDSSGDNIYNEGDTNNFTWIDNSSSTVLSPSGDVNFIDQLIYDGSTKTYYVDAHEEYDVENNTYVSNKYEYQYHIAYTSVTYIGQTEEYEETYKYYYQLPDGRSSADLTKEDLEQLSLSFKDVVNYARTADDLSQRVLYHFDGNTTDASYWSYATKFDWGSGASLTYMDEGVFGGSLYLDENVHDFTITLPSERDAAGDFTLQFRYYQSYTATTGSSRVLIGGTPVLYFTGAQYKSPSGSITAPTSVGSWNEICLMRKDYVLYYYVNGVCLGSVADTASYNNTIGFVFDSVQQTYKKLDELRFTRGAIYEAGEDYTVSSVPFDSNLALVLPDGEFPLADETVKLVPAVDNMLDQYGLNDWTTSAVSGRLETHTEGLSEYDLGSLYYNPSYTTITYGSGYTGVATSGYSSSSGRSGLFFPVSYYDELWDDEYEEYVHYDSGCLLSEGSTYTLSVYLNDGSYSFVTFKPQDPVWHDELVSISGTYDTAGIAFRVDTHGYSFEDDGIDRSWSGINIEPTAGSTANIVYMELVKGTGPHFTLDYEYAVYSSGQLTQSPVLAVRSALDVTSYQFGGVRPSYPEIGQVWALVENGRISSLQQYTGYAWESVDGRIWTGQRWVPYYAFDVLLLKDMFDIIEADPSQDFIYTQEGFWSWLQKAWAQMLDKLDQIAKGSGGTAVDPDDLPAVPDDPLTDDDDGWSFIDLLVVVKDGLWSFTTGVLSATFGGIAELASGMGYVTGFFNSYSKDNSEIFGVVNYGGSDIWD